jgi:adenylyltransferase/sulfurtransferase
MERYLRQVSLKGFGEEAQLKLRRARVLLVGLGGLGSASSLYLTAAGVGHLTIADDDAVEPSDLNRQILHWSGDIGRVKVQSAAEKLRSLNPETEIEPVCERVTEENATDLVRGADLVLDGTDNYTTRYLLNRVSVRLRKPFIHGACEGFLGQLSVILPGGPCLRCIVPFPPRERGGVPILSPTAGIVGCLQGLEAIKLITGVGEPLMGKLLVFDGRSLSFQEIEVHKNPNCPVCSNGEV